MIKFCSWTNYHIFPFYELECKNDVPKCKDPDRCCDKYKNKGYCKEGHRYSGWTRKHCPKACHVPNCKKTTTTTTTTPTISTTTTTTTPPTVNGKLKRYMPLFNSMSVPVEMFLIVHYVGLYFDIGSRYTCRFAGKFICRLHW